MPTRPGFRFRFFRAGGVDQIDLSDPDALRHLRELDLKLWLSLACPTRGTEIDARTLELIDTDRDGRIRPPELLAALDWANEVFADAKDLYDGDDALPLASLSATDAGRAVLDTARRILADIGRAGADAVRLSDISDTERIFAQTTFNGDGVIPVEAAADDEAARAAITDAIAVVGSVPDRSGKPGIDRAKAEAFFDQVAAFQAWLSAGDAEGVRVLGDATAAAFDALAAVRAKVDDYFTRARLAGFDARLVPALGGSIDEIQALAAAELTPDDARVGRWPLARVGAGLPLPLREGVNPAWAAKIRAFASLVVEPALGQGRSALTEGDWAALLARFAPYAAWTAAKPGLPVGALGADRVRALAADGVRAKVLDLVAKDAALEGEYRRIEAVEKALRLRRDLVRLLRNYVSFADFYGKRDAIFQAGTLYIDGRRCDLCLPVNDVSKHALLAGHANACLLYCDCTRKKDAEKRAVVAAVTAGDVDNLFVGRNGVFYDRKGDDWDATVTRIVENPTSVRQAFWSPYKRFIRMIQEQVAKRASAAEAQSNKSLETHAAAIAAAGPDKPAPQAAGSLPAPTKFDVGTIAALGVAVGGIAAFFSSVFATFLGLGMWMPLGVAALVLAISGPSMLIAWLKLSQRNIGPLLDANGWAVNALARVNVPFGGALTRVARLPEGARRILDDPFAVKRSPVEAYVAAFVVAAIGLAWAAGKLDTFVPGWARAETVLHHASPAQHKAP